MRESVRRCARYAILFCPPSGRSRMAESFCRRMPRYLPCDLLREIRERYGIGALFTGEAVLFGWSFAFTFLSDLYSVRFPAEGSALGFLCCAAAFGLCREGSFRAVLKYGYLVCALFCGFLCVKILRKSGICFEGGNQDGGLLSDPAVLRKEQNPLV